MQLIAGSSTNSLNTKSLAIPLTYNKATKSEFNIL